MDVEKNHNFFANGILVHNKGNGGGGGTTGGAGSMGVGAGAADPAAAVGAEHGGVGPGVAGASTGVGGPSGHGEGPSVASVSEGGTGVSAAEAAAQGIAGVIPVETEKIGTNISYPYLYRMNNALIFKSAKTFGGDCCRHL